MASKEDDPFYSIIETMREQGRTDNPVPFLIGTVAGTNPLKIKTGEIIIGRERIKINTFLLAGYRRRLRLDTTAATGQTAERGGGGGYEAFSSHSHGQSTIGVPDGTFTTLDDFFVGDEVLLLQSADQQQYILLCKLG